MGVSGARVHGVPGSFTLLRHAEAKSPRGRQNDFDRVLSSRGEADARRLGDWLRAKSIQFDRVLCSPAVRTRSTLAIALPNWTTAAQLPPSLYLADLDALRELLDAGGSAAHVLLIGHNPGLEQLAHWLCQETTPRALPTCGLLRICAEIGDDGHHALIDSWQP